MLNHSNQALINLGQAFTHFFFVYGGHFNEGIIINSKLEFALGHQEAVYSSVASALQI
jgi:hypothetical protein